jgi:hypothetical protein
LGKGALAGRLVGLPIRNRFLRTYDSYRHENHLQRSA